MKTIVFEDDGQDFLEWDLDPEGKVVECRPFQGDIWCGNVVVNHRTLRAGQRATVHFVKFRDFDVRRIIHIVHSIKTSAKTRP